MMEEVAVEPRAAPQSLARPQQVEFSQRRLAPAPAPASIRAPTPLPSPEPAPTPAATARACKNTCEWSVKADYLNAIKNASGKEYQAYLAERAKGDNRFNPTFYIDVAEYFAAFNRTLALQILSNVADLALDNAYLYKSLMYYFKQYEAFDDCLYAAKKIASWRSFEPQSHRDLALAHELVGDVKEAARSLSNALNTTFYAEVANRVDGMQDSILMDVNRLVGEYGSSAFVGLFDGKYLKPLPVDLRVIMTWSQPNVDLDLHVVDPSGEECYYGHKRTNAGGRFSKDFTVGLGP